MSRCFLCQSNGEHLDSSISFFLSNRSNAKMLYNTKCFALNSAEYMHGHIQHHLLYRLDSSCLYPVDAIFPVAVYFRHTVGSA